jgi:hypothetical protein
MTGYVRQRDANIVNGSNGNASDVKVEFDQVQLAFNATTGHKHDGSSGEGVPITVTGLGQDYIFDPAAIKPKTTAAYDLGSSSLKFKDGHFSGTVYVASLSPSNPSATRTNLGATAIGSALFTAVDAAAARTILATPNYQAFTASGTWTKPEGVRFVYVECVGAGGGGANNQSANNASNGGAGGTYFARLLDASSLGATVTVTVGASGTGGASGTISNGGTGGTSSFGSLASAVGGNGGLAGDYNFATAADGDVKGSNGGNGNANNPASGDSNGQSTYDGGGGGGGARYPANVATSGGTSKRSGNGGVGSVSNTVPGGNGVAPGGGGGGCRGLSGNGAGGGAGGRGEVRVWSW